MTDEYVELGVVILIDARGWVLLQLRDEDAPHYPGVWALPGGHREPGEDIVETAYRELLEETGLRPVGEFHHIETDHMHVAHRVKHYFAAATTAVQADVVLGEGAAMVFTSPDDLLDGRSFTPGTVEVLTRFLASPRYRALWSSVI